MFANGAESSSQCLCVYYRRLAAEYFTAPSEAARVKENKLLILRQGPLQVWSLKLMQGYHFLLLRS